jgi:hypothetical protein
MLQFDAIGRVMCPVKIGDRIIVHGRPEKAAVENLHYVDHEMRWCITLDWGQFGMSRVWSDDENKVWIRYAGTN